MVPDIEAVAKRGPQSRTTGRPLENRDTEAYPDNPAVGGWMESKGLAVLVTIGFSLLGVVGDYFLKLASGEENSLRSKWFFIGFAVYASTAFGWVFVMKHLKLATIGVLYSVSMIVLLTAIGIVFFRESLAPLEIVGLLMAIGSLVILVRFA